MKVWMAWHGGYSYAAPSWTDNLEPFDSIGEAVRAFDRRLNSFDSYYPCVDESASAVLFDYDPTDSGDPYPFREITVGPRGGIRVTPC